MNIAKSRYIASTAVVLIAAIATACGNGAPVATTVAPATTSTAQPATVPTVTEASRAAAPVTDQALSFSWKIEEVDAGTKPALALTSDRVPYVAFMLEAMPGFVKNAVRSGSSWDVTTVAEGYFYGPLDIAIGPDDAAHISYHDHQDPDQFKSDLGDATHAVLAASGGDWDVEAVFDNGHDGWDNRVTVDAQGRPHMSAIDPEEFGGPGVEYYR